VIEAFLNALPDRLAEFGHGMTDDSPLFAFEPVAERRQPKVEIKRALALVDRAARVWAAEAVYHDGQEGSANWIGQLSEVKTTDDARHIEGLLAAARGPAGGYARYAVGYARRAADAAGRIEDDLPGVDNSEQLHEVAQEAASCLAAWAAEALRFHDVVHIALNTADELSTIR
jgi:hypothetical protein